MPERDEDLTNVPKSVLKQQREADKLVEEIGEKPGENIDTIDAPPATPAPDIDAVPAIETAAIIDTNDQSTQWEHKYSVLQGKYNKEIGEFRDQLAELQLSFDRQSKIIEDLNSKQLTPPSKIDADSNVGDLNPEDFDGWGQEMKDMVSTVNRLNAVIRDQSEIIGTLRTGKGETQPDGSMDKRVESIEQEIGKTRTDRYSQTLDSTIKGDWRALNKDPKFISWLNETDPITLQPRMHHLRAAAQELRGDQVSSIFNQYIEIAGIKQTNKSSFVDDLPAGGGGGEPGVDTSINRLTEADVKKAQQDHIHGRITEEEFDKIYSDFQKELRRQRK